VSVGETLPETDVDAAIASVCRPGLVQLTSVQVAASSAELIELMQQAAESLRQQHAGDPPGSIERVQVVRAMYRDLGMDPHHTRPSSEALLRRVLRGDDLPRVNRIVDAANLWSLQTLCPVGLYNAGRIEGPISFRFGTEGEGYQGIRKDWVNVSDRPALFDRAGPFGNPTSDSARTAVDESTRAVLAVAFQPAAFPTTEVEDLADILARFGARAA